MLDNLIHQKDDHGVALLSLVDQYIQQCCRTYYSITNSEQQDIAQEASIKLLVHYDNLKNNISKRWLYVMVKNLCLDALRKQRTHHTLGYSIDDKETNEYQELTLQDFEPYSYFDNHQCLDNVFAYIKAQPTGQEDLMVYSHFAYGLNRTDIANITGRTVGAVTKRISILRARLKKLRNELC